MEMDVGVDVALVEEDALGGHPGNLESQFHNLLIMY